jgi:RNA polymerase sigma-70 factor (ECF subfamily)
VTTTFTSIPIRLADAQVSDSALAVLAKNGDTRAYSELVRRCRSGVVGVVYRMCGDFALAEEAAQEAFLRAWQHLSGYNPQNTFKSWVYRIAINAALDHLRRARPAASLEDWTEREIPLPDQAAGPEETLAEREQVEQVRRAVLALPAASRAVLVLREYGEMSYAEIAAALGIPLGTVMSRLNSARSQLRAALAGRLEVL